MISFLHVFASTLRLWEYLAPSMCLNCQQLRFCTGRQGWKHSGVMSVLAKIVHQINLPTSLPCRLETVDAIILVHLPAWFCPPCSARSLAEKAPILKDVWVKNRSATEISTRFTPLGAQRMKFNSPKYPKPFKIDY